jgi:hypothetical protein
MVKMAYGQFVSDLDPRTLEILTEAFHKAWDDLLAGNGKGVVDDETTRDRLGRRIIVVAITEGATDAQKLAQLALDGFDP